VQWRGWLRSSRQLCRAGGECWIGMTHLYSGGSLSTEICMRAALMQGRKAALETRLTICNRRTVRNTTEHIVSDTQTSFPERLAVGA